MTHTQKVVLYSVAGAYVVLVLSLLARACTKLVHRTGRFVYRVLHHVHTQQKLAAERDDHVDCGC